MPKNSSRNAGRHFLQIPGPTPLPDRVLRAMDTPIIDHRGPEFGKARQARARRRQDHLQDRQSGHHLHRDRHRRVGSRPRQHAVARRPRADGRDRPVRHPVEEHGDQARAQAGVHLDRLAHRRRPRRHRGQAARGQGPRDQGGVRAAQRDRDGLPVADRRDPQGDRPRRPSGAAPGRHHLLARLDRLPPRRVGRRRHHRRRPEGPDAAAGHVVQRGERQGDRRVEEFEAREVVLVVGGHAQRQQERLLPLHAGDQHAPGPRRRDRHAARGRPRERVRAA